MTRDSAAPVQGERLPLLHNQHSFTFEQKDAFLQRALFSHTVGGRTMNVEDEDCSVLYSDGVCLQDGKPYDGIAPHNSKTTNVLRGAVLLQQVDRQQQQYPHMNDDNYNVPATAAAPTTGTRTTLMPFLSSETPAKGSPTTPMFNGAPSWPPSLDVPLSQQKSSTDPRYALTENGVYQEASPVSRCTIITAATSSRERACSLASDCTGSPAVQHQWLATTTTTTAPTTGFPAITETGHERTLSLSSAETASTTFAASSGLRMKHNASTPAAAASLMGMHKEELQRRLATARHLLGVSLTSLNQACAMAATAPSLTPSRLSPVCSDEADQRVDIDTAIRRSAETAQAALQIIMPQQTFLLKRDDDQREKQAKSYNRHGVSGFRLAHPDEFRNPSSFLKIYGDPQCQGSMISGTSYENNQPQKGKYGNWKCKKCQNVNYPRRFRCNNAHCRAPRDPEGDAIVSHYACQVFHWYQSVGGSSVAHDREAMMSAAFSTDL